uniref:Gnk2-homologous domain-containing protein n=1 Tax=Steinernema glaseri TaxID=37863 RepID=A0A1I8AGK7_9BILA
MNAACILVVSFLVAFLPLSLSQSNYRNIGGGIKAVPFEGAVPKGRRVCDLTAAFVAIMGNPASYYEVRCSDLPHEDDEACTTCCHLALLGRYPGLQKDQISGLLINLRDTVPLEEAAPQPGDLKPLDARCSCCHPVLPM